MTQTPPPLPFPPPSPFPPSPFPSLPSLFPFPKYPFLSSLFSLFSLSPTAKRPPEIARGLAERFSSPSGVRGGSPDANAFWVNLDPGNAFSGSYLQYSHQYDPYIWGKSPPPPEGGILSPLEPNWTQVASTSPSVDAPD